VHPSARYHVLESDEEPDEHVPQRRLSPYMALSTTTGALELTTVAALMPAS
jgi:hypothetical protein